MSKAKGKKERPERKGWKIKLSTNEPGFQTRLQRIRGIDYGWSSDEFEYKVVNVKRVIRDGIHGIRETGRNEVGRNYLPRRINRDKKPA